MGRAVRWKLTYAVALMAVASCAAREPEAGDAIGTVAVDLQVAEGVALDQIAFTVRSEGAQAMMTGTLPIQPGSQPVRSTIENVPIGKAEVQLRGTSRDGSVCEGSGKTSVLRGRHSALLILLHCWLRHRGDIDLHGRFNACPDAELATCVTSSGRVGGPPLAFGATASDRDGDALEFHWTASTGAFSDEDAQSTQYTCTSEGPQTIVFSVEDSKGCKDRLEFPIVCGPPAQPQCGNGAEEPGEECDDGNLVAGDGCTADCRLEKPNDSVLCGDDPGGALENCTCERCTEFVLAAENAEGDAAEGPGAGRPKSELAIELLECLRDTGCEGFACLCGTVIPMMCREDIASNGPCKAQFLAAAETESEGEAEERMTMTQYAVGLAFAVEDCAAEECGACL